MENRGSEHSEGFKTAEKRMQSLSEFARILQRKALELIPDPVALSYAELLRRIKEGDDPATQAFQNKYADQIEASIPILAHALTHGYISGLLDRLVAASGLLLQTTTIPIDCALKQSFDAEGVKEDQELAAKLFCNYPRMVEETYHKWSPMIPNSLMLEAIQGETPLLPSPRRDYWAGTNLLRDAINAGGAKATVPSKIMGLQVEYLYEGARTEMPTVSLVVEKLL